MASVEAIQHTPHEDAAAPPMSQLPPTAQLALAPTANLADAELATAKLTHSHYENFSVVSTLLPKRLRQDFCNVYAFCRVADDLGDEVGDRQKSLQLLNQFAAMTRACYDGPPETRLPLRP